MAYCGISEISWKSLLFASSHYDEHLLKEGSDIKDLQSTNEKQIRDAFALEKSYYKAIVFMCCRNYFR